MKCLETVFAKEIMQNFRNPTQFQRKNFSLLQGNEI